MKKEMQKSLHGMRLVPLSLLILFPIALSAQSAMEHNGMMMGGWMMFVCGLLLILLFVLMVLGIMALLKYLFGRKP